MNKLVIIENIYTIRYLNLFHYKYKQIYNNILERIIKEMGVIKAYRPFSRRMSHSKERTNASKHEED